MSFLGGVGSPANPRTYAYYTFDIPTFTIAAMSAASPYVVTGSTKTFTANTNVSSTVFANKTFFVGINGISWGIQSGNSTDTYNVVLQTSVDAQMTWTTKATIGANLGGANTGKTYSVDIGAILIDGPWTNNQIHIRTAITDATSPTTDAFTLAPMSVTYQFYYAK